MVDIAEGLDDLVADFHEIGEGERRGIELMCLEFGEEEFIDAFADAGAADFGATLVTEQ